MKTTAIALALFFLPQLIYSQMVVSDPVVGQATTSMQVSEAKGLMETYKQTKIYEKLLEHKEDIQLAMETYDVIQKLESVKKLHDLLDKLICATDDFEFYLQLSDSYDNCLMQVELDRMLVKFESSSDIMFLIFGGVKLMSSGERIKNLTDAINLLDEAYSEMMMIQSNIRISVRQQMVKEYVQSAMLNEYSADKAISQTAGK